MLVPASAAAHPDRLPSLALMEPAWAGNDRSPSEAALAERFAARRDLPPEEFMAGFVGLQLAPGAQPPPRPDGPPPWMAKRPAGLRAFLSAFDGGELDLAPARDGLGGRLRSHQ